MTAPILVPVLGLLETRLQAMVDPLLNPFDDLDFAFADEDHLD